MPKAIESEKIHFAHSLFGRPFFINDAVGGDEDAATIGAEAAVDEDFLTRMAAEKREKLDDLFVVWRVPGVDGDVDEMHAQRFGELAFPGDLFGVFCTQIDNRRDAQLFQL